MDTCLGRYKIRNGRNRGILSEMCAKSQASIDIGVLLEMNLT